MNGRDAYAWLIQADHALAFADEEVNRARRALGEVMLALGEEIRKEAGTAHTETKPDVPDPPQNPWTPTGPNDPAGCGMAGYQLSDMRDE